jgi:hypothetical protein
MRMVIGSTTIAVLVLSAAAPGPAGPAPRNYTIQILAAPAENESAVSVLYDRLRRQGYPVYRYRRPIAGRLYWRLRAGVFADAAVAEAYAKRFGEKEGFAPFVSEVDAWVDVSRFADRFEVVTTPSGIWVQRGASARWIYNAGDKEIDVLGANLCISPDGTAAAFHHAGRILKVTLGTGQIRILKYAGQDNELLDPLLRWSPDGQYLAYLDAPQRERPTNLWVVRSDGTEHRCLAGDQTGQRKVKSFLWHPSANKIFCILGPTHGTVSVGGDLLCTDLDGNREVVAAAAPERRTEVRSDLRIADGFLHYTVVRFGADGRIEESTPLRHLILPAVPLAPGASR